MPSSQGARVQSLGVPRRIVAGLVLGGAALAAIVLLVRPESLQSRAERALGEQRWEEADRAVRQILNSAPQNPQAMRLLARAQLGQGKVDESWRLIRQIDTSVLSPEDLHAIASSLERHQQPFLARLVRETQEPSTDKTAPRGATTPAEVDALEVSARLASLEPPAARLAVVLSLLDPDRVGASEAATADALLRALDGAPVAFGTEAAPDRVAALQAWALLGLGRYADALQRLEAIDPSTQAADLRLLRSRALLGVGRVGDAIAALQQGTLAATAAEIRVDPAPYVGSEACAPCHPNHVRTQQGSFHARTFWGARELDHLALPEGPTADPDVAGAQHRLERDSGRLRAQVNVGDEAYRADVDYGFGSGRRGVTLVGRDEANQPRELRLSFYANGSWGRTTGHAPHPASAVDHLGRPISMRDLLSCLGCHTTEPRSARDATGPTATDRGIGCEGCHGPGGNHVLAAQATFPDPAIALPTGARASEITRLCGQCHKPRGAGVADPGAGVAAARFQSATLPLSRCYDPASAALTCVTCHDPHRDRAPSLGAYSAICLVCHGPAQPKPAQKSCPVEPAGKCVSCHMPKVPSSMAQTEFTDHHIRVHPAHAPGP